MRRRERIERLVEKFPQRFRVLDLLQLFHPLLVRHAVGLQLVDLLRLQPVDLPPQDRVGILDDRLAQRQHVERIIRRRPVQQRQRVDQVKRKRLVQRKIVLQLDVHAQLSPRRLRWNPFHDLPVEQRAKQLPRPLAQRALAMRRLVASPRSTAASPGSRRSRG